MDLELAKIKNVKTGMSNGGWGYDTHKYLEPLDAGKTMEIADIKGPAVIKSIMTTKHDVFTTDKEIKKSVPRGIVLLIYYNGSDEPSVEVPLADFFCDGCNGKSDYFTNIFIENTHESYMCYFPIPFEKSCRVCLRNDTKFNLGNSSFVQFEELDNWDKTLGYFHSTYKRTSFQSTPETILPVFKLEDCSGHFIGQQLSISTDEKTFEGFSWLMEANNEIRIDTDKPLGNGPYSKGQGPSYDYLGTECAFGFAWGWGKNTGLRIGCPYINTISIKELITPIFNGKYKRDNKQVGFLELSDEDRADVIINFNGLDIKDPLSQISVYRFYYPDMIRFRKSIDWRLNWTFEGQDPGSFYRNKLSSMAEAGKLYADYAYVNYWYQNKVGYKHDKLPRVEERSREVVKSNIKSC